MRLFVILLSTIRALASSEKLMATVTCPTQKSKPPKQKVLTVSIVSLMNRLNQPMNQRMMTKSAESEKLMKRRS